MVSPKNILIGGGTGFIGSHLCDLLKSKGFGTTVISRMPGLNRLTWSKLKNCGIPENTYAVVNLAGQNILDATQRWNAGFKQNVYNSRVETTALLANLIAKSKQKPSVFVSISGVSVYKAHPTKCYDEFSENVTDKNDFLAKLCIDMENANKPAVPHCRVVTVRSGVVLGKEGGMIKQLYMPFSLGLGGPIAPGNQFLPWIHIDDLTGLILFAIENPEVAGVINAVAPKACTNTEFSTAFAKALNRPAFFKVPEFVFNLVFGQERAQMVTHGQKVYPKRALEYKYVFKYPDIQTACKGIVYNE